MNLYASLLVNTSLNFSKQNSRRLFEIIAVKIAEEFAKTEECLILQLAVSENVSQQILDKQLLNIDLETLQGESALIFAYAWQSHMELKFNEYNEPRLKGLISFHKFNNLNQSVYFSKMLKTANNCGCLPVLSYDFALRYYLPQKYRIFSDAGIYVSSNYEYKHLLKEYKKSGYKIVKWIKVFDVIDQENKVKMRVLGEKVFPDSNILTDALEVNFLGGNCLIPSPEELICIIIYKIWIKLRGGSSVNDIAFVIYDLNCFIKQQNILWDKVFKKLNDWEMLSAGYFVYILVENIIPGLIPAGLFSNVDNNQFYSFFEKEYSYFKSRYKSDGEAKFQFLRVIISQVKNHGVKL